MVRQEGGDPIAVLLWQHRAGGVDEAATWFNQPRRGLEQRRLLLLALGEVGGPQPPLGIGSAAPSTRAGARGVNKDEVEPRPEGSQRGGIPGAEHLRVAHIGPLEPFENGTQARR